MKTLKIAKYFAAGLLAVTMTTSCSDYLDKEPDTELDMSMVFTNRDKVYSMLSYVYNIIHQPDKYRLIDDGYEVFADDLAPSRRWEQWNWANTVPKIFGQWTINSRWNGDLWAGMPRYIRHGYILEQNIKALPDQDIPQKEVDNIKNEIRFLTAYGWWQMAEAYGGIPFKPNYIAPTDFTLSDLMIGQSKFDDVVDYCDKEMLEAANALPASYDDPAKYGRITKIMALTVRARMLLFAASPLVNGNPWYNNYRNKEGQQIFSQSYDPKKWVKAAEACKLCIDEAEKAGYQLYKEYNDDGTVDPFMSTYNVHIKRWSEGNREITFPVTKGNAYSAAEGLLIWSTVREAGGGNGLGLYQGLVDAFFTKNGLPISDANSNYHEEGFSNAVDRRDTKWEYGTGKPGEITSARTYNMYCNREPRFYNAVTYNGAWLTYLNRKADMMYNHVDNIRSSSPHDAPQNGYLVRKAICMTDNIQTGNVTARQGFIYRLAFTYLDYAEAENEAYDNAEARSSALEYLNRIRERAGVRQYTFDNVDALNEDYIHIDNTQEALRKAIRAERRVELCFEDNRWYDIRRWKDAENLPEMTGDGYGMNSEGTTAANFYKRTVFQHRIWKRQYYWMPVYIDEYEKNPNLVQGPFWVD
ncbi:MAG: RagB/SusD family nutrient uptake outer membrane protein [Prevotella sp.]|nr:RagB/SusD family nutrient uptake outer membrane protein [Prevotella sp.]